MHLSIIPLLCAFDVYRQKVLAVDRDKNPNGGASFLTIGVRFKGLSSLGRVVVVWKCFVFVWQEKTMSFIFKKKIFFCLLWKQIGHVYCFLLVDSPDSGEFFSFVYSLVLKNFWKCWLQPGALSNINRQLADMQNSATQLPPEWPFQSLYKAAENIHSFKSPFKEKIRKKHTF